MSCNFNLMDTFNQVAADLLRFYGPDGDGLSEEDINQWSELTGLNRATLYDQIALHLAHGFHANEMPFEFCDRIVNAIHGVITLAGEDWPEIFWATFLAFDEGEYYHQSNPEEDPVELFTKPQIADIVVKYGAHKSPHKA